MVPQLGSFEHAEQTLKRWEEQKRWRIAEARGDDLTDLAKELRWAADMRTQYLKPLPVSEIAAAFKDEAPALCKRHIKICTRILNRWDNDARKIKNDFDDPDQWAQIVVIQLQYPEFAWKHRKALKNIFSATTLTTAKKEEFLESITETDVEAARAVAIEGLYDWTNPKRISGRFRACCPFHNENTGSFFIFQDNKFKCFGCSEHGDSIDFIIKTMNFEFLEAVKYLIKK